VHLARLKNGDKVAVKVQYPDIEEIVRTDLRALRRIFAVLGRFMPEWGFDTIYREIREMVLSELDYRKEAEAMRAHRRQLQAPPDVLLPRVVAEHSTARVLTTSGWPAPRPPTRPPHRDGIDRGRRRARWSRPTASRSSSTASITPIRTRGTCSCGPSRGQGRAHLVFLDFGATAEVSQGCARGWCPSSRAP
jgi:hypothetical protein